MSQQTIITPVQSSSQPFKIDEGQEIVLVASGLQGGTTVRFEMVRLTAAAQRGGVCCIRDATIDIEWQQPLLRNCTLPDGSHSLVEVKLTESIPWVVLRQPAGVLLRAIVESDDPQADAVTVILETRPAIGEFVEAPFEPDQCCSETSENWEPTGQYRCYIVEAPTGGNPSGEYQQLWVNAGCATEWRYEAALVWTDSGQRRCVPGATSSPTYAIETERVTQCGESRWFVGGTGTWQADGTVQCSTTNDTAVLERQTTVCGDYRWVASATQTQVWTAQGIYRLTDDIEVVQQQQTNQCGRARWVDEPAVWVADGVYRLTDNPEVVQQRQSNQAGGTKWVDEPAEWSDTGEFRPTSNPEVVQEKQVNQAGGIKWVDRPAVWSDTGITRCSGNNAEKQQVNQAGVTKWVLVGALTWVETGNTRCVDDLLQVQEINDCGITRWRTTTQACGFVATLPLPGGGSAFRPTDPRDPAATVALQGCDGNVIGYIYPTPREGASVAVSEGCTECGDGGSILGYAVDGPGLVDRTVYSRTRVTAFPRLAVQYVKNAAGQGKLIWNDGSVTSLNID